MQSNCAYRGSTGTKQGTLYAWYRQEGDREWTAMETHRPALPNHVQVGVSLINTTSDPFTVRFEDFAVEQRSTGRTRSPFEFTP
jgi:hypothetical protein